MPDHPSDLETRVAELSAQLLALSRRVDRLSARLEPEPKPALATAAEPPSRATTDAVDALPALAAAEDAGMSDNLLSWAGRAALLPRLSALCFLLVVALGLRTVTDYGTIDRHLGSLMGMGYAALLMAAGWYLYRRQVGLAPVFAACGSLLMTVIALETHARFGALSTPAAYALLALTGIAMALLSRGYNRFLPVSLGIAGMCVAGLAIDYPNPVYPELVLMLAVANVLGYSAARLRRCSWLRWSVLAVTLGVLFLWAYRLRFALQNPGALYAGLAPGQFLPVMALLALLYPALAFIGLWRGRGERASRFDLAVPAVAALGIVSLARMAPAGDAARWLGAGGVALGLAQLAGAFLLAGRRPAQTAGAGAFCAGAALFLAQALPPAVGQPLVALPLLSAAALGLAGLARRWESAGARLAADALQVYAVVALGFHLRAAGLSGPLPAALAALVSTGLAFAHYRLGVGQPAPLAGAVALPRRVGDPAAVVLLLATLLAGFLALRVGLYQALKVMPVDLNNSFRAAQSVLINLSAIGLMLFALVRHNREVRNVALIVTLLGAIKVFVFDMLGTHGLPLVMSVFSFGLAAALESVALGRWNRVQKP